MTRMLGLAFSVGLAFAAGACGSAAPPPETPATPAPTSAAAAPTSAQAPGGGPAAATSSAPAAGAAAPAGPSTPLQPSTMLEDLKKAGVNLSVPLEKVPLATKKKVMKLIQKSVGFDACTGCHIEGDFKKETRNIKIARQMWDHFVSGLRDEKGGPIFCDSCHAGKLTVLNRSNKEAVKKFMETQYVDKLARADKKEHECATCHDEAMELRIIDKLWKIPK